MSECINIRIFSCMSTFKCVSVHVSMYVGLYVCVPVCTYVFIEGCMYVWIYVRMDVCMLLVMHSSKSKSCIAECRYVIVSRGEDIYAIEANCPACQFPVIKGKVNMTSLVLVFMLNSHLDKVMLTTVVRL